MTNHVKKLSLVVATTLFGCLAVFGDAFDNLTISVCTISDHYADGQYVRAGEWYVLVWVRTGATFAGFNSDFTLRNDPADAALFLWAQTQYEGCLYLHQFSVSRYAQGNFPGWEGYLGKGTWNVYFLDTRVPDGKGGYTLAETVSGKPQTVNAWGLVEALEIASVSEKSKIGYKDEDEDRRQIAVADVAPIVSGDGSHEEKIPVFSAITAEPTQVHLWVTNTVDNIWYEIARSESLLLLGNDSSKTTAPFQGNAALPVEIVMPRTATESNMFYRVIRHLPNEEVEP